MTGEVMIRPRQPEDLPALAWVLTAQRARSRYPVRWPLPFPVEQFIARDGEMHAWTALLDGTPIGHAAVTAVTETEVGLAWAAGAGRPVEELACVATLFVGDDVRGLGVGGRLLDTAVAVIVESGRTPVLDVVRSHSPAAAIYQARGWTVVGEARPTWLPADEQPVLLMALLDDRA